MHPELTNESKHQFDFGWLFSSLGALGNAVSNRPFLLGSISSAHVQTHILFPRSKMV